MPKVELGIMRYSNYKAVEISAEPTAISGGGTPYYPLLLINLSVTLKPILSAEGNPINFALAQMGGYLSLPNNERIADFLTEPIFSETHDKEYTFPQPLTVPLDLMRVERIEAVRSGGDIQLNLHFWGAVWIKDNGEYKVPDKMVSSGNFLALKIPQSHWVDKVLPNLGYGKFKLIEVPISEKADSNAFQEAQKELVQAQQYLAKGDYDKAVGLCQRAIEELPKSLPLSSGEEPKMNLEEFSKQLEGKDLNQLVHKAKRESEERILGQGTAHLAMFISNLMMEAVMPDESSSSNQKEVGRDLS